MPTPVALISVCGAFLGGVPTDIFASAIVDRRGVVGVDS